MPLTFEQFQSLKNKGLSVDQIVRFEKGEQPSQEPVQETQDQNLPLMERLKGGFRRPEELEQVRETQRAERGLPSGTPLEPTGFNLENVKDLPGDVIDAVGPAFPAIGQFIGGALAGIASVPTTGGTAAPMAIAAGGVSGAMLGETVRQTIGQVLLGYEQGSMSERAGRIALEGALGAVGEGVGIGLNKLIRATKSGIIKTANNLLKSKNIDKSVKALGMIFKNTDSKEISFALERMRVGDNSVISDFFGAEDFADKFTKELFFGKENNLAKQIYTLARQPESREAFKAFFGTRLGLSDDAFDIIVNKGKAVNAYADDKGILNLGKRIVSAFEGEPGKKNGLFDIMGRQLASARAGLAKKAGAVDVSDLVTQNNVVLADELTKIGLLVDESGGLRKSFSLNPNFKATTTGAAQKNIFSELIERFFGKENISDSQIRAALKGGMRAKDLEEFGRKKLITPEIKMDFKDFIQRLKTIDVQISGSEFKSIGQLSPRLAEFLKGLRNITDAVADQVGDVNTKAATQAFRELAEGAAPIRMGSRMKNAAQVESILKKFGKPSTGAMEEAGEAFSNFIKKNLGIDLLDEIKTFNAAMEVKELSNPIRNAPQRRAFATLLKNAFNSSNTITLNTYENTVDSFLPASLKVALNARRHTVAEAITKDALSLLRARFIGSGLQLPTFTRMAASGLLGGAIGGPVGASLGLGAGWAMQSPSVMKALLKGASAFGGKEIAQTPAKQIPREVAVGGTQLLKSLLQKNR